MKALILSAAKKLGYIFAVFIILTAILVCVSRMLTPVLDKHRADFEKYASELLQTPIGIERVRVSWYQYQPVLSLDSVTVLNKENKEPVLQIKRVRIFFSLPQSLWQRKAVVSGFMISGTDLNIHENASGQVSIQGFPLLGGFQNTPYKNETKLKDGLAWLSAQPHFMLQDIDVRYTKFSGETYSATLNDFTVNNRGTKHTILGKGILHQEISTKVTLVLQWEGETLDPAKIKAKAYLYISGLSLSQWLKKFSYAGWQIKKGMTSAKIWATWNQGKFRKIQSTVRLLNVELFSERTKSIYQINRFSGNIGWKRQDKAQIIAGDDILIDLPNHLWPATSFYISLLPDVNGKLAPKTAMLGYVDFSDIQTFLFASPPFMSQKVEQTIMHLKPRGVLQNAAITFADPWTDFSRLSLRVNFSQLSSVPWQKWPGVNNLSGGVRWNGNQGEFILNVNRAQVLYDALFANPINIDQLSGSLFVKRDQQNAWQLSTSSLHLLNGDAAANVNFILTLPDKAQPFIDMNANFTLQNARNITRYLPLHAFAKELTSWLKQAFLAGEVQSGRAVLKGKWSDFPFDKNDGTFLMTGSVKNIDLSYAPDWPHLKHINGELTFAGRKMEVAIKQAQIMNIPINHVKALIPYLGEDKPQILAVQSDPISMDFADGLAFIHKSPLEKRIGRMFKDIDISGPTQLTLSLTIPLNNPEKTEVLGGLLLQNTTMNLAPWKLLINQLNGEMQFTQDGVSSKEIKGEIFNKPIAFHLESNKKSKKSKTESEVRAIFNTQLNVGDLENWLQLPLTQYANGSSALQGEINLALNAPIALHLKSNLQGIALTLPGELSKKADEARDLSVDIFVQEKAPLRFKADYGQHLSAALLLDRKQNQFSLVGASLLLGKGRAEWPKTAGLYIAGNFDKLDWNKVQSYLGQSNQTDQSNFSKNMANLKLQAIDIRAAILNLAGLNLNQIHMQVVPAKTNWNVTIDSADINGKLQIPMNFNRENSMTAQFDNLKLPALTETPKTETFQFTVKSLPAISFSANNVSYNDIPLGQVTFKTSPSSNGLVIRSLAIVSSRMNLQASGSWTESNKTFLTRLQGKADSARVSDLLNSFGLDIRNFIVDKGELTFDLNWRDAPYAPSLSGLNGRASLELGKGRIVDVGQGNDAKMSIGRMLSIFSLQTIPRRLSLDFSDVFQSGYSFDSVQGDFSFQNGDAYTSNFHFDGPVARVGINGRIGLKDKDYNFTLSVTPYVTTTLPIAATIVGGPLVGAAALAVNSIIGSQISKAVATHYYVVTGPWDNPSWRSVNSEKAN